MIIDYRVWPGCVCLKPHPQPMKDEMTIFSYPRVLSTRNTWHKARTSGAAASRLNNACSPARSRAVQVMAGGVLARPTYEFQCSLSTGGVQLQAMDEGCSTYQTKDPSDCMEYWLSCVQHHSVCAVCTFCTAE